MSDFDKFMDSNWSLIVKIPFIVFGFYLFMKFWEFISKVTNTNISYRGGIIARPDDFDKSVQSFKKKTQEVKVSLQSFYEKLAKSSENKFDVAESLNLLKELDQLKKSDIISEAEYKSIKDSIMNKVYKSINS